MTFVDCHCHLDDEKLKNDVERVVAAFRAAGVGIVLNVGCDAQSSKTVASQAEAIDGVYFAAGIHPSEVKDADISDLDIIAELAAREKCVAIGEIGLDYHWDKSYTDKQKDFFIRQIRLADELRLPLNVHVRDAMGDAVKILKDNKDKLRYGGVMHCFSGSVETAKELMALGFYISFGGTLTFPNSLKTCAVAATIPADRLLTETDSPYLAPVPKRGTVNSPVNIPLIVKKLAEVRGEDELFIKRAVYENAKRLFYKIDGKTPVKD